MRLGLAISASLAALAASSALAQPVVATQGRWIGTCVRPPKSAKLDLFVDQGGARLDGIPATAFSKTGNAISFQIQTNKLLEVFKGSFSPDTASVSGTLSTNGKVANCSGVRKIDTPNRVCISNKDQPVVWWKLELGTPASAVRLNQGQEDHGTGAAGGKLCWGTSEASANSCARSLPQSSYAC